MTGTAQNSAAEVAAAAEGMEVDAGETATVGRILRTAREAARLSIDDVAHALKFSPRQVVSLEADDYGALPGNTIVRGFTRSYARLLKLDADELLHMLDGRTPIVPADVRPPDNMGIASDSNSPQQFTPVVSVTIVVALAALLLGLWHYFGPSTKPQPTAVQTEAKTAPLLPQVPPAAVSEPVATDARPASVAPVEAGAAAVVADGRAEPPRLIFVFDERSWLEVVDASKQMLHSGENPAGSRLELVGRPPFDIVVGNAGKVRLTYGDREVDLAPHTRAEVARFRLE